MTTESPIQVLRSTGLRQTLGRIHVLQVIQAAPHALWEPETVCRVLAERGLNITLGSAYRSLRDFERAGILRREWHPGFSGMKAAYRLKLADDRESDSHRIVCGICAQSIPIDDDALLEHLLRFMERHQMDSRNGPIILTAACHCHRYRAKSRSRDLSNARNPPSVAQA